MSRPKSAPISSGAELGFGFENVGLRYGLGPEILRDLSFLIPGPFLPVSHRPVGRRQDLVAEAVVPVAAADARSGQSVRPRRLVARKDQVADLRKRSGIVLQDFRLLDHMTTYENVRLPFRVMGREESTYRREVIDLEWVGLGRADGCVPPILSGGEKATARDCARGDSRGRNCCWRTSRPAASIDLGRRLLRLFIELTNRHRCDLIAPTTSPLMDQYEARRLVLHQDGCNL